MTPPGARAQNARGSGEQLRAELVDAATALLLQPQQVSPPSLRSIARAVQVSPAAVYLHFDSQASLLRAVIEGQLASLTDAMAGAATGLDDPRDILIATGIGYAHWGLAHPGAYQLVFESADVLPIEDGGSQPGENIILGVAALLAAHRGRSDPQDCKPEALRLWSALHGLVSLRMHKPEIDWHGAIDDDARALIDALL